MLKVTGVYNNHVDKEKCYVVAYKEGEVQGRLIHKFPGCRLHEGEHITIRHSTLFDPTPEEVATWLMVARLKGIKGMLEVWDTGCHVWAGTVGPQTRTIRGVIIQRLDHCILDLGEIGFNSLDCCTRVPEAEAQKMLLVARLKGVKV